MTEKVCVICYDDIDDINKSIKCCNKCSTHVCTDCMGALINYSDTLPSCPNQNCNGYYMISELKSLNREIKNKYYLSCFNYIYKSDGDTINKRVEEKKIIAKIRKEKIKFMEDKFPKGIIFVAKKVLSHKLNKLNKQRKDMINKKLDKSKKLCMNSMCNGYLDQDYNCMTCSTDFCKKCEKLKKPNHKCKKEDLDSINLINNMTHCPKCHLPVFKNEGCDSITCANCDTNFVYSTGKIGGHGSSNTKITVRRERKLSVDLEEVIPANCMEYILKLESSKPATVSKDVVLSPFINYNSDTSNKITIGRKVAKNLEKFTLNKHKNKVYYNKLIAIEKLLLEKLDEKVLRKKLKKHSSCEFMN
jgi:uncharacterized Zn finger protein (UPF0148 family)